MASSDEISITGEYIPDEVIIKLRDISEFPGQERQYRQTIARLNRAGIYPELENHNTYVIREDMLRNPRAVLNRWKNHEFIEYAEPNYIMESFLTPNDPYYNAQAEVLTFIGAQNGWDIITSGGPIVAVIDGGFASSHQDLPKFHATHAVQNGVLFNTPSKPPNQYHGLHVTGVLGAIGNNGTGVAGINWDAKLMLINADNASGDLTSANCSTGIIWAADNGAKIINMSWGTRSVSSSIESAVNYAYNKGCVLVAATGNDGLATATWPARYSNVIGVGSTSNGNTRVLSSAYGTGLDVVASGTYITTDISGYGSVTGTSFASPQVAGLASLMWALKPELRNVEVINYIKGGAGRFNDPTTFGVFINNEIAYGCINIRRTLEMVQAHVYKPKPTGNGSVTINNWTYHSLPSNPVIVSSTNGTAGLTILYTGRLSTEYSGSVQPSNAGDYTLTVTFPENNDYAGFEVSVNFSIGKAIPPVQTPRPASVVLKPDLKLSDVILPSGWSWNMPATPIETTGTKKYTATYQHIPASSNYHSIQRTISFTVRSQSSTSNKNIALFILAGGAVIALVSIGAVVITRINAKRRSG